MTCNVLISSAGRRVGLLRAFRSALARAGVDGGVFACDSSRLAAAMHEADASFEVPPCGSPDFLEAIRTICRTHGVRMIIPTIDPELPVYARAREWLAEDGIMVQISSAATIAIGGDKRRTNAWLRERGFPCVRQWTDAEEASARAAFPVVVKPAAGSGSVGLRRASTADVLRAMTLTADDVIEEIAPGLEFTLDALVSGEGRCVSLVPRRRIEVRAGEVSKAVTVRHESLERLGHAIVHALPGAFGPLNIQVFVDGDHLTVIEINPRFGGGFPLSLAAGADFPLWMVEAVLGLPSTATSAWEAGLLMLRYDDAVFVHRDGHR